VFEDSAFDIRGRCRPSREGQQEERSRDVIFSTHCCALMSPCFWRCTAARRRPASTPRLTNRVSCRLTRRLTNIDYTEDGPSASSACRQPAMQPRASNGDSSNAPTGPASLAALQRLIPDHRRRGPPSALVDVERIASLRRGSRPHTSWRAVEHRHDRSQAVRRDHYVEVVVWMGGRTGACVVLQERGPIAVAGVLERELRGSAASRTGPRFRI